MTLSMTGSLKSNFTISHIANENEVLYSVLPPYNKQMTREEHTR